MSGHTETHPEIVVVSAQEPKASTPEPGLTRKVLAYTDKLFLVEHSMRKGWVGTLHSHPHEQAVYVVRGHLEVRSAGKFFEVRTGDSFVVRGGVEHGARALEESLVIDAFTPMREDYV